MVHDVSNSSNTASNDRLVSADYAELIGIDPAVEWLMESSEQLALVALTQNLRPKCVIEVGCRFGGSMQIFSRFSERVISLDIDPTCPDRLGPKYPNAEFITGPSQQTLQPLLDRFQRDNVALSLMLIDGDHSAAGVQGDIHALLGYRPACTLYVVIHDSFNPDVRRGIRTARWSDNPYVHSVELDFIPGVMHHKPNEYRQMWGGFALAVLRPDPRNHPLTVFARKDYLYRTVRGRSAHRLFDPPSLAHRAARKLRRLIGKKD